MAHLPADVPAASGLFDTIGDLPLHPLIVHVAVVFLPVASLALIVLVFVPRWRGTFGWLTMAALAIGAAGAFASKESGEALAARIGNPPDHARLGDILPLFAFALLGLALVWFLLERRASKLDSKPSAALTVLGIGTAVLAVATIVLTVLVGHSGAKAAWAWRIVPQSTSSSSASTDQGGSSSSASGSLTVASVQEHSRPSDCWSVVDGNVYDFTDWIDQHPGGSGDIVSMCGKDATAAFDAQHGGQGRPNQELGQFLLGALQ